MAIFAKEIVIFDTSADWEISTAWRKGAPNDDVTSQSTAPSSHTASFKPVSELMVSDDIVALYRGDDSEYFPARLFEWVMHVAKRLNDVQTGDLTS